MQSLDPEIPLVLGDFGTYRDVIYENEASAPLGLGIGFKHGDTDYTCELAFAFRAQRREIIQRSFKIFGPRSSPLITITQSRSKGGYGLEQIGAVKYPTGQRQRVQLFHYVPRLPLSSNVTLSNMGDEGIEILKRVDAPLRQFVDKINGVQHLGPNREAPQRYYPFSGERPTTLTSAGAGATDMLLADVTRRGTGKGRLARDVENWLIKAQMADQLRISPMSDRHYEVKLRHPVSGELVNYSDVGFGISQILPVLVAGYNLGPGGLFMVEQPEIHLHPRAQSELGDFLFDLYQSRVQTIIETHSEHLIMRIQRHVASGKIRPEHVAVNYIFATEGKKVAVRLRLNEDGIFTDPWPQGFFEERLGEALALARAPLVRDSDVG
jgi:hypothetical protein